MSIVSTIGRVFLSHGRTNPGSAPNGAAPAAPESARLPHSETATFPSNANLTLDAEIRRELGKNRIDFFGEELIDLLGRAPHVAATVEKLVQVTGNARDRKSVV